VLDVGVVPPVEGAVIDGDGVPPHSGLCWFSASSHGPETSPGVEVDGSTATVVEVVGVDVVDVLDVVEVLEALADDDARLVSNCTTPAPARATPLPARTRPATMAGLRTPLLRIFFNIVLLRWGVG